jgi:hypothetical protein
MNLWKGPAGTPDNKIDKTINLGTRVTMDSDGIITPKGAITITGSLSMFKDNDVVFFDKDIEVSDKKTIFKNTNVKIAYIDSNSNFFKLQYMNGNPISFLNNADIPNIPNNTTMTKRISMLEEIDAGVNIGSSEHTVTVDGLDLSKVELSGLRVYIKDYIFKARSQLTPGDYFINDFKVKSKKLKFTGNDTTYFSISQEKNAAESVDITLKDNINYINSFKSIQQRSNGENNSVTNYKDVVKKIEKTGNLRFYPHRLAHLNEIKTAAYYGADWDDVGWINDANPQLYNKSNLVKIKDKKVMWIDKEDENAVNKGVVCYGRKLDQNKLGANDKNEMYNFQMEKIEQNIKDIQKYENVSNFNKEIYSRWNL